MEGTYDVAVEDAKQPDSIQQVRDELKRSFDMLRSTTCALGSLKLLICDAGVGVGIAFSKASCYAEPPLYSFHAFPNVFRTGYEVLFNFIERGEKPKEKELEILLNKFIEFILKLEGTLHHVV